MVNCCQSVGKSWGFGIADPLCVMAVGPDIGGRHCHHLHRLASARGIQSTGSGSHRGHRYDPAHGPLAVTPKKHSRDCCAKRQAPPHSGSVRSQAPANTLAACTFALWAFNAGPLHRAIYHSKRLARALQSQDALAYAYEAERVSQRSQSPTSWRHTWDRYRRTGTCLAAHQTRGIHQSIPVRSRGRGSAQCGSPNQKHVSARGHQLARL